MAFGFRPISNLGSDETIPITDYSITAGATAIYFGDPVKQATDGSIQVAASGDLIIGIFAGCSYYDAKGKFQKSKNYDGSATYTDIRALVYDDPKTVFEVLANDYATADHIGSLYDFNYAPGSDTNGISGVYLNIASGLKTGMAFRITRLSNRVGDNASVVQGVWVEHALAGISSGTGGA